MMDASSPAGLPGVGPPGAGTLLLAPPTLRDPNFRRTVVLLCERNAHGSFGLILNRPIDLHLGEVLDELSAYGDPLSVGGPVQPDTLHFIHRYGEHVPEAVPLANDVYWGGSFEAIKALASSGEATARELRFFIGYAGWSPGQLEAELRAEGGWLRTPVTPPLAFPEDPAALWRTGMRHLGGEYALLSTFPDDPRMN